MSVKGRKTVRCEVEEKNLRRRYPETDETEPKPKPHISASEFSQSEPSVH